MIGSANPREVFSHIEYLANEFGAEEWIKYLGNEIIDEFGEKAKNALIITGIGMLGAYEFCEKSLNRGIKSTFEDTKNEFLRIISYKKDRTEYKF